MAAQALRAACLTVDPYRPPHSLHAYFVRPGRPSTELILQVDRTRDGRSFTTRHVTALQQGEAIFTLTASFHAPEEGVDWDPASPVESSPEDAAVQGGSMFSAFWSNNPFEIQPCHDPGETFGIHPCWVRLREAIPADDPSLAFCALTYVSDMAVVSSARAPVEQPPAFAGASLDHAVWFHRPFDPCQWMLFEVEPVTNYGARGLARGRFSTPDGVRVATVAQEALLRPSSRAEASWRPPGAEGAAR